MPIKTKKPTTELSLILFDIIDNVVIPTTKEMTKEIAEEIRQDLVNKINNQSFSSFSKNPLKPSTIKRKGKDDVLIDTREYINSIQVFKIPEGYMVGVGEQLHKHRGKNALPMNALAQIHEFGLPEHNIPPRPHWRPVINKYKKEYARKGRSKLEKMNLEKKIETALERYTKNTKED